MKGLDHLLQDKASLVESHVRMEAKRRAADEKRQQDIEPQQAAMVPRLAVVQ